MSHTPTPWHTTDRGYRITIDSGDEIALAEVFPMNEVYEKAANARLIVSAVNSHAQLTNALHEFPSDTAMTVAMETGGATLRRVLDAYHRADVLRCNALAALRAAEPDENEGDV